MTARQASGSAPMSSSRGLFRSGKGRLTGSSHFARSGAGWSGRQPRALRVIVYASSYRQIVASSGVIPKNRSTPSTPSGSKYSPLLELNDHMIK